MTKIVATGFGVAALASGQIIHFDAAEKKAKKPDMRKLEDDVPIEDARRVVALGWAKFADDKDNVDDEPSNGAIVAAAVHLEGLDAVDSAAPAPAKPKAVRKPAVRKPAVKKPKTVAAPAAPAAAAPATEPAPAAGGADEGDQAGAGDNEPDLEAGPA